MTIGELLQAYAGHGIVIEADTWEDCIEINKTPHDITKYDGIEVKSFYSDYHDWLTVDIGIDGWKKIKEG